MSHQRVHAFSFLAVSVRVLVLEVDRIRGSLIEPLFAEPSQHACDIRRADPAWRTDWRFVRVTAGSPTTSCAA